jgi:hypothetical protein
MPSPPRAIDAGEPKARRFYLVALRDAARDVWGPTAEKAIVDAIPRPERDEVLDARRPDWVSERVIIAYGLVTWEGPAGRDKPTMHKFLRRHVDHGFGRVRRFLLGLAQPARFFESIPTYWRHDHTHGVVSARLELGLGVVELRDHPYAESVQMRTGIAEIFRYTVSLMRARNVTETHALASDGALVMRFRWE